VSPHGQREEIRTNERQCVRTEKRQCVRTVERQKIRTLSRRNKLGAWVAMLTCPCHGVMLLYLGLGTAWGATLFAYREWLYGALGVAFVAGLWLFLRRDATCAIDQAQPHVERS
jgi:hypothetical protein